jgi:transcriptional regulator with XRE-family HTH domain
MLGTTQSNISQFESLGNGDQPRLTTLMRYARALGGTIEFTIVPEDES